MESAAEEDVYVENTMASAKVTVGGTEETECVVVSGGLVSEALKSLKQQIGGVLTEFITAQYGEKEENDDPIPWEDEKGEDDE